MLNLNEPDKNFIKDMRKIVDELKQEDSVVRIQLNDQRLMKLAEYDATKGYMNIQATPDDFQSRFLELKGLVKRGSFTIKTLEDNVYNKWGIPENSRDECINKERDENITPINKIGFNINTMPVADIKVDSSENH